jgi:hypothetical protein
LIGVLNLGGVDLVGNGVGIDPIEKIVEGRLRV